MKHDMLKPHRFLKDLSDFFAETDTSFQTLECILNFLCYSQCNSLQTWHFKIFFLIN